MIRFLVHCGIATVAVVTLLVIVLRVYTALSYRGDIVRPEAAPPVETAIVFGAGLDVRGRPSPVLHDRVAVAAELYHQGAVQSLLLSGARREPHYDEPEAMRRLARSLGVPDSAIVLDPDGYRTLATCRGARSSFDRQAAILVTQQFHLPRALLLCDAAGISVAGVAADRRRYPLRYRASWQVREALATTVAWWDITLAPRLPDRPRWLPRS